MKVTLTRSVCGGNRLEMAFPKEDYYFHSSDSVTPVTLRSLTASKHNKRGFGLLESDHYAQLEQKTCYAYGINQQMTTMDSNT